MPGHLGLTEARAGCVSQGHIRTREDLKNVMGAAQARIQWQLVPHQSPRVLRVLQERIRQILQQLHPAHVLNVMQTHCLLKEVMRRPTACRFARRVFGEIQGIALRAPYRLTKLNQDLGHVNRAQKGQIVELEAPSVFASGAIRTLVGRAPSVSQASIKTLKEQ
jgi:hypothetical protein